MKLIILLLLVLTALVLVMTQSSEIDKNRAFDEFLWNILSRSIEHEDFDLERAQNAINKMSSRQISQLLQGKPLVHQLLNYYWTNNDPSFRDGLVELALQSIAKGAPVDAKVNGEPPALLKALLIREMRVAVSIAQATRGDKDSVDSSMLREIYSIPCNPTPLTKLLLHAHSVYQQTADSASVREEYLRDILARARLTGQNAVLRNTDIYTFSETHRALLGTLVAANSTGDVYLTEIMESLGEVANKVQERLLAHFTSRPSIVAEALMPSLPDNRGPLHILAMSGSSVLVSELTGFFKSITRDSTQEDDYQLALEYLREALRARDSRSHTAAEYVKLRFGSSSKQLEAMRELYDFAGLSFDLFSQLNLPASNRETMLNDRLQATIQAAREDLGGWSDVEIDSDLQGDLQRCDILEQFGPIPSAEEFFEKYVSTGTPVVFRGAALNSTIRQAFRKENFLKRYGSEIAPKSVIPYAGSFGLDSKLIKLRDIANITGVIDGRSQPQTPQEEDKSLKIEKCEDRGSTCSTPSKLEEAPEYVFAVLSQKLQTRLKRDAPIPSCLRIKLDGGRLVSERDGSVAMQFYLGPAGSGAPMHFHGHAANTLAYGIKKWFLYPPKLSFYSKTPAFSFISSSVDNRASNALQCTQFAGDVFFVPTLFGHATINIRQSIGVAHEFSVEEFCME